MPGLAVQVIRLLAAVLGVALFTAPARAADPCGGLDDYRASPRTALQVARPEIRNDLPLTVVKGRRGRGESVLMGKIHVEKQYRYDTRYRILKAPKGRGVCVALETVEVKVDLTPVTIYIAEQSAPGSCEYKVTLRHEEKHLQYEREAMQAALKKLEGRIRASRKPFHADSEKSARERAEKLIGDWVETAMQNASQEADRSHDRLDSHNNARREAEQCR